MPDTGVISTQALANHGKVSRVTTNVIVNLQFEGVHRWRACPHEEVAFLKDFHRHIFHICCKKQVRHDDRDIEIIMLKRQIHNYLHTTYRDGNLGDMSCEMLAGELVTRFGLCYCSVLEDGENGAEVTKELVGMAE